MPGYISEENMGFAGRLPLILLIFALLTFLKEVQLATRTLQMGKEFMDDESSS